MNAPAGGTIPSIPTTLTRQLGIRVPVICGPMYPCSNPELVAAVSAAGGIGIVQPELEGPQTRPSGPWVVTSWRASRVRRRKRFAPA